MVERLRDIAVGVLLFIGLTLTGCGIENTVSDANEQHRFLLGSREDALYTWMNSRAAVRDTFAAELGIDGKVDDEGVNYGGIAKKCITASSRVRSYESRFFLRDFTSEKVKDKDYIYIEWYVEHEKPGKFDVEQIAWGENVSDRWTSLGRKHYCLIRAWFEDSNGSWRTEINKFLTLDKYVQILRDNSIESAEKYHHGEMELYVLKYSPKDFGVALDKSTDLDFHAEIWINEENLIVAASVKMVGSDGENKIDSEYRQLFAGYNRRFNIKKPEEVL